MFLKLCLLILPLLLFANDVLLKNTGTIKGWNYVEYKVDIQEEQKLVVDFKSTNRFMYFNVRENKNKYIFVGNQMSEPNRFESKNLKKGTYTISVYFMRVEARRNHIASFDLDVHVEDKTRQ